MLPCRKESGKIEKLRKNYEFQKVYRQGSYLSTPLTLLVFKNNDLGKNRLGIVISKKVGKSVIRHRLKRLYTEAFRTINREENLKCGYDFVIIARKGSQQLDYHGVIRELKKLFAKGKLMS